MSRSQSSADSTESEAERQIYERPGDSPAISLVLQFSVFLIVGALLLLLAPDGPWSIRLLLIALVFVTLKRWAGVLVLMLVQGDLLLREGRSIPPMNQFVGPLFVTIVIGVLMFVARNRRRLLEAAGGPLFSQIKSLLPRAELDTSVPSSGDSGAMAVRLMSSAVRGMVMIVGCVTLARVILAQLPRNRELTGTLREFVNLDPSMAAAAVLIVSLIAVWVVVSEISWRQMTQAQARMYLRSTFMRMHYRDLRLVVKRRFKLRQKRIAEARSKNKDRLG